ncbi:hypothetical protein BH10ACI4_BH10ACI4_13450 [soil metagenome]
MRKILQRITTGTLLLCSLTLAAQEKGNWHATSNTARSITGDVVLSDNKLTINFLAFAIARIRALEKSEVSAVFDADSNAEGAGSLYRLNVPATTKFLHKNSLCGGEDTHWMVTYVTGRTLQLAFFSGQKSPTFAPEAIANSTDLCGTFTYTK